MAATVPTSKSRVMNPASCSRMPAGEPHVHPRETARVHRTDRGTWLMTRESVGVESRRAERRPVDALCTPATSKWRLLHCQSWSTAGDKTSSRTKAVASMVLHDPKIEATTTR